MMTLRYLAAFALLAVAFAQSPVKVAVYYESLCPDSKAFITTQLYPAFTTVSEIFTVDFYPYGRENETANGDVWDFQCQHGPLECVGNKIHACALNYYPDNVNSVPFISCSMNLQDDIVGGSEQCANELGLDWATINDCSNSDLGSQLLHGYGIDTNSLSPPLGYVPWIILNDVYSDNNENQAQTDFLGLLCATYEGPLPAECTA